MHGADDSIEPSRGKGRRSLEAQLAAAEQHTNRPHGSKDTQSRFIHNLTNYHPQVCERWKNVGRVFQNGFTFYYYYFLSRCQSDEFPTNADSLFQNDNCASGATYCEFCAVAWQLTFYCNTVPSLHYLNIEANMQWINKSLSSRHNW